jgi:hypothetical protein
MREELHHLVDQLPEAEVQPVLELIRGWADTAHGARDLPFFASFESDPDLAENSEEILQVSAGLLGAQQPSAAATHRWMLYSIYA